MKPSKPDKQFRETARLLRKLIENKGATNQWSEQAALRNLLREKFELAFGLSPDRRKLAYRFFGRFENTELTPKERLFDHEEFYQRGESLVFVSQPYGIEKVELSRWTKEFGASFVIASEWGYYYPGHAKLFLIEFSPKAKAEMDKRIRKRL